jgi:hypothetical protein
LGSENVTSNTPEVTTLVRLAPAASDTAVNQNVPTARLAVSASVTDAVPPRRALN